jgi:RNA polymerase sigma factor (sigma-70 family)
VGAARGVIDGPSRGRSSPGVGGSRATDIADPVPRVAAGWRETGVAAAWRETEIAAPRATQLAPGGATQLAPPSATQLDPGGGSMGLRCAGSTPRPRSSIHGAPSATCTVDEIGELYARRSKQLEQIVRLSVRAPQPVVEDACQFAWSRLVHRRAQVRRDTALGWLAKTALHEAVKLIRRTQRDVSLDFEVEEEHEKLGLRAWAAAPPELLEQRERLGQIRALPDRQQRLLWLQLLGLSYAEIAVHERCTARTVERQLLRAKRRLRSRVEGAARTN